MSSHTWGTWGVSVRGPLHMKIDLPNQDAWGCQSYSWGTVLVVSDGLGSKKYASHGSKMACCAAIEVARSYQSISTENFTDFLRQLHAHWLTLLSPYSPSDCLATCLVAVQTQEKILLARLGDGMIISCGKDAYENTVLYDNKDTSFSNYTCSLQENFNISHWQICEILSASCQAIILCTDGVADDLERDKASAFAQELYAFYADMEPVARQQDILSWLDQWPVVGHTDDKTLACLYKEDNVND